MCTRIITWWSNKGEGLIPNQRNTSERKPLCTGRPSSRAREEKSTPFMKRAGLALDCSGSWRRWGSNAMWSVRRNSARKKSDRGGGPTTGGGPVAHPHWPGCDRDIGVNQLIVRGEQEKGVRSAH